jgi:tRNA A-37 threonylcarbamoyl transferase component Bud32
MSGIQVSSTSLFRRKSQSMRKSNVLAWVTMGLGVLICLTGAVNLTEHLLGLDWGLALPVCQLSDAKPLTFPGHIAPDAGFGLVVLGIALACRDLSYKGVVVAKALAMLLALPNFIVVVGYLCGTPHICAFFGCLRLAAFTSLLFSLAAFSILFNKPESSLTGIFVVNSLGGRLMRSIGLGVVALIPLLYLIQRGISFKIYGQEEGLYDERFAFGLMAFFAVTILGACVAWGARRMDSAQVEVSQQMQSMRESLQWSTANPRKFVKRVCLTCSTEYDDETLKQCPKDSTELTRIAEDVSIGALFNERYHVLSLLGKGGNSTVYKAKHVFMNKMVALKVLQQHLASDAKALQRFKREAQSTAILSHPNLVAVQDFGVTEDGRAFLVMDYLEGECLSDLVERRNGLGWREAVPLFIQILDGLSHAHEKAIIHRDLKPSDIMLVLGTDGALVARVVDFGLAKSVEVAAASKLTQTGELFGSPCYMSPEQCRGEKLDYRSDIYSMGCLMYQTIANKTPFLGENVFETLKQHVFQAPPPLPVQAAAPVWLSAVIRECMAKDVETRMQSAAQLRDRLSRELANSLKPAGM